MSTFQDLEKAKREGASPKDIEKAETKLKKAHDDYKALVDKYNVIREDFEKKMTMSCKVSYCHLNAENKRSFHASISMS